jgi:hypothetical protein
MQFVQLVIYTLCEMHGLLDPVSCITVESLCNAHLSRLVLSFQNCHLLRLFVYFWLEGVIDLLLFLVHSQFLKFFISFFLKLANPGMNRGLPIELIHVDC